MFKSLAAPAALITGVIAVVLTFIVLRLVTFGLEHLEPSAPKLTNVVWGILAFEIFGHGLIFMIPFVVGGGSAVYVLYHWPRRSGAFDEVRLAAQWIKDNKWAYVTRAGIVAVVLAVGLKPVADFLISKSPGWPPTLAVFAFFAVALVILYPFAVLFIAYYRGMKEVVAGRGPRAPAPQRTQQGAGQPSLGDL